MCAIVITRGLNPSFFIPDFICIVTKVYNWILFNAKLMDYLDQCYSLEIVVDKMIFPHPNPWNL